MMPSKFETWLEAEVSQLLYHSFFLQPSYLATVKFNSPKIFTIILHSCKRLVKLVVMYTIKYTLKLYFLETISHGCKRLDLPWE